MGVGVSQENITYDENNSDGAGKPNNDSNGEFCYDGLCISSGGYRGIGMLGALAILDMKGYFKHAKYFSGCSVGAVIILLYVCGWKPIELYMKSVTVKIFNGFSDLNLKEFKSKFGLMSSDMLKSELELLVLEKRKKIPTLLDLHNEGYYISFSITDRRTKKGYKIDYISHPTLLGTDAAMLSSNIPFIFSPIDFEGMKVADGALSNPFPLDYIDNKKRRILGIVVYEKETDESSFISYLVETLMIQIEESQRNTTKHASNMVDVLELKVDDLGMFTGASYKPRNKIFFSGMRDGKLLVKAIEKRQRREVRHSMRQTAVQGNTKQTQKSEYPDEKTIGGKTSEENIAEGKPAKEKLPPRDGKLPKAKAKTNIRYIPDEIVVKCFLSQPIDVLSQAAKVSKQTIDRCFKLLSPDKQDKLKILAREIIHEELASGIRVTKVEAPDTRYNNTPNIKVKENYSQRLYDHLPTQLKAAVKVMVDSMPKEQADRTIGGVNIIIEGLSRIGVDVFGGFLMGPTDDRENNRTGENTNNRNDYIYEEGVLPKESNAHRIEILPDEPKRNKMDDID